MPVLLSPDEYRVLHRHPSRCANREQVATHGQLDVQRSHAKLTHRGRYAQALAISQGVQRDLALGCVHFEGESAATLQVVGMGSSVVLAE